MRQVTRRALLYTEMIVANALHHSKKRNQLLDFYEIEKPISLQIGGDDPKLLSEATKLAEEWGYDEINLNLGCPSPRVQSGNFGACLMADPYKVAKCIEAMKKASDLPITVKHRIGIDNLDSDELLIKFVDSLASAGAERFIVHARRAWLKGLNPKENRTIPELQYNRVSKLKKERPQLKIELNGGLTMPNDCLKALETFDGVMVGRAAYSHPLRWTKIDEFIYGESPQKINASKIIRGLIPYAENHIKNNGRLWDLCRHIIQLVEEVPGARAWRRDLCLKAQRKNAKTIVLEEAARQLEDAGL